MKLYFNKKTPQFNKHLLSTYKTGEGDGADIFQNLVSTCRRSCYKYLQNINLTIGPRLASNLYEARVLKRFATLKGIIQYTRV